MFSCVPNCCSPPFSCPVWVLGVDIGTDWILRGRMSVRLRGRFCATPCGISKQTPKKVLSEAVGKHTCVNWSFGSTLLGFSLLYGQTHGDIAATWLRSEMWLKWYGSGICGLTVCKSTSEKHACLNSTKIFSGWGVPLKGVWLYRLMAARPENCLYVHAERDVAVISYQFINLLATCAHLFWQVKVGDVASSLISASNIIVMS